MGSVEVIFGGMFAGKTEALISALTREKYAHRRVGVFKPVVDTRYSDDRVVTHGAQGIGCIPVNDPAEILDLAVHLDVVGIDECQFFAPSIVGVVLTLGQTRRVICAGLDMDFKGQVFPTMANLAAMADVVTKPRAVCVNCGAAATFSHRTGEDKNTLLLGGVEAYEPLCRRCFGLYAH